MQGKTLLYVLVVLTIGFVAGFALRPVILPPAATVIAGSSGFLPVAAPRAMQYFGAHLDEAKVVVAGCAAGSVRGDECANAQRAIGEAEGKARTDRFLGVKP